MKKDGTPRPGKGLDVIGDFLQYESGHLKDGDSGAPILRGKQLVGMVRRDNYLKPPEEPRWTKIERT